MYRAVLLALLIMTPAAVTAAPSSGFATTAPVAESSMLTLSDAARTGVGVTQLDVGTTIALGADKGTAQLEQYTLSEQLKTTDDPQATINRFINDTRSDVKQLKRRERQARRAVDNQSLTASEFLKELAIIQVKALSHQKQVDRLAMIDEERAAIDVRTQLASIDSRLITLTGPIRARASESLQGETASGRVAVAGYSDGVALAMIEGTRYRREAIRMDYWTAREPNEFGLEQAVDRIAELYPDAFNESPQYGVNVLGAGIFRLELTPSGRTIVAHLDGTTEQVFSEHQTWRLDVIERGPAKTVVDNGTQLSVNRTIPGGPLRIVTRDNRTGVPITASVHVDGVQVSTGSDGVVWVLSPQTPRFTVSATTQQGSVTITVRALGVRSLGG